MSSERKVPTFRPFKESVKMIKQIDVEALNQRILALHHSQIITPDLWNLRVTI